MTVLHGNDGENVWANDQPPTRLGARRQGLSPRRPLRPIGLALGGGGARGFAHIGVLEALEASPYQVIEIAGTSAGALYAAGYAFGLRPGDLHEHARQAPRLRIFRPWPGRGALIGHDALTEWLFDIFGDARIEELPLPLTIVATRARDGETVYLREGPLVPAVVASATIPLVFPPVEINGELLVDGGVSLPVPETALSGQHPVIAVDLGPGPMQSAINLPPKVARIIEGAIQGIPFAHLRAGIMASYRQNTCCYQGAVSRFCIRPAVTSWEDIAYGRVDDIVARGRKAAYSVLAEVEKAGAWTGLGGHQSPDQTLAS